MYRLLIGLFFISKYNAEYFLTAMQSGIQATMVVLAIAVGATLPDMIAHQVLEKAKHKRLQCLLAAARAANEEEVALETDIDQASNIK